MPSIDPLVRAWRALLLAQALLARAASPASANAVSQPMPSLTDEARAHMDSGTSSSSRRADLQASATLALLVGLGGLCSVAGSRRPDGSPAEASSIGGEPSETIAAVASALSGPTGIGEVVNTAAERRMACIELLLETLVRILIVGGVRPPSSRPSESSASALVPVDIVLDEPSIRSAPALTVWQLAGRLAAELDRILAKVSPEPVEPDSETAGGSSGPPALGRLIRARISLAYLGALLASAPTPDSSSRPNSGGRSSGLSIEASKLFAECIRLGRFISLVGRSDTAMKPSVPASLSLALNSASSHIATGDAGMQRLAHADRLIWKARKRLELAGLDDHAVQGLPKAAFVATQTSSRTFESSLLAPPRRLRGKRLADRRQGTYVPFSPPPASPLFSTASISSSSSSLTTSAASARRLSSRNQSTTSLPSLERRRSTDLLRPSISTNLSGRNQNSPVGVKSAGAALFGDCQTLEVPSLLLKSPIPRPLPTLLDPHAIFANGGSAATAVAGGALVAYQPVNSSATPDEVSSPSWARVLRRQASSTFARIWQPANALTPSAVADSALSVANDTIDSKTTSLGFPSQSIAYQGTIASPAPSVCPSLASDTTAGTTVAGSPPTVGVAFEASPAILTPRAIPWTSVLPAIGFTPSSHDTLGLEDDEADEKPADGTRYPRMSAGGFRRGGVLRSFSPVPSRLRGAFRASRP